MKNILLRVKNKVLFELETIQELEGLKSRTSTITYLIKYYFLTKKHSFDDKADLFEKVLKKIDFDSLPSLEEQLKDI